MECYLLIRLRNHYQRWGMGYRKQVISNLYRKRNWISIILYYLEWHAARGCIKNHQAAPVQGSFYHDWNFIHGPSRCSIGSASVRNVQLKWHLINGCIPGSKRYKWKHCAFLPIYFVFVFFPFWHCIHIFVPSLTWLR